jgi:hypothetical protein
MIMKSFQSSGFSEQQIDDLMTKTSECTLMWATKDGWPVGVIHAYAWLDEKVWLTFSSHRHRAEAIRRDNRVSVTVSSSAKTSKDCPKKKKQNARVPTPCEGR